MVGWTHRWLVERIVCWLDFMEAMDIWSLWTIWLVWTYWTVWSLWSLWTQARRTTYELSICENMYISIRTPSACVSMSAALSGVLSPEVFSTASGFFSVPSQTRAREKKRKKEIAGNFHFLFHFFIRVLSLHSPALRSRSLMFLSLIHI